MHVADIVLYRHPVIIRNLVVDVLHAVDSHLVASDRSEVRVFSFLVHGAFLGIVPRTNANLCTRVDHDLVTSGAPWKCRTMPPSANVDHVVVEDKSFDIIKFSNCFPDVNAPSTDTVLCLSVLFLDGVSVLSLLLKFVVAGVVLVPPVSVPIVAVAVVPSSIETFALVSVPTLTRVVSVRPALR